MSRLIDADALRESIITRQTEMSYEDAWALTCVDNAPTIEPQKWIPCSEKLPEYEEYVLVTFIDKSTIDTKVMCVRRIEGFADWYWSDFADEYTWEASEVIAWMPLPESYKEEQHD